MEIQMEEVIDDKKMMDYCCKVRDGQESLLNKESPLRNKMKVVIMGAGDLPYFEIEDKAWCLDHETLEVNEISGKKRIVVPIFEMAVSIEMYDHDFESVADEDRVTCILDKADMMLKNEIVVFNKIEGYLEEGRGVVPIRNPLTVLPYRDHKMHKKIYGFAIFEQLGVAVLK